MTSSPDANSQPDHTTEDIAPSTPNQASPQPIDDITANEVDREVTEAMAAMSAEDLAELGGEVVAQQTATPGAELTGSIVGLSDEDIFLEFGSKLQGILPRSQFGKKESLEVGRRVDVVVERVDSDDNTLFVVRKGAALRASWNTLSKGMVVEGRVTGVVRGGLELDLKGIRAFMPGSQVDIAPMKDISLLLGTSVRCEVVEFDRRSKNVIVSRRKQLERDRKEARDKLLAELEVGQTRRGVVSNLAEFGAFVDLGGVDGLIHIRDLSWGTVEKVSDVLSPGQEVEVKILRVDTARDRISLGLKQALPDPWNGVEERFPNGTNIKARVVKLVEFGAFAEVEPGVEGLIHLAEMGWSHVRKPSEAVSPGDVVDVVVLKAEAGRRRISLSMRQATPDPWEGVEERFPAQSLVKGRVTRLADFGAFVELSPGIEGLIHISELSDRRVRTCSDVVQADQEIEARVLSVDVENRRISLSIKAVREPATQQPSTTVQTPEKKKRKKPLRGGLSSHFDW